MADDSKKIFVSYRRALSTDFVHRLRDHLKARGFDVFVDVQSIPSGKFADTILHQIEARPHFLAVLVPGALERTTSEDDWYRREIEHALATRRNVIPLLAKGFSFAEEQRRLRCDSLPGRLEELKQYQYLSFIYEYDEQFEANINVLTTRFLVIPEGTRVVPTPKKERETVREMLKVADFAKADRSGSEWILPLQSRFLFMPLPAPKLSEPAKGRFTWTAVTGASGYVLQVAWDEAFSNPQDLYDGDQTNWSVQASSLPRLGALGLAGWESPPGPGLGWSPSIQESSRRRSSPPATIA
jgi:TIR domain